MLALTATANHLAEDDVEKQDDGDATTAETAQHHEEGIDPFGGVVAAAQRCHTAVALIVERVVAVHEGQLLDICLERFVGVAQGRFKESFLEPEHGDYLFTLIHPLLCPGSNVSIVGEDDIAVVAEGPDAGGVAMEAVANDRRVFSGNGDGIVVGDIVVQEGDAVAAGVVRETVVTKGVVID